MGMPSLRYPDYLPYKWLSRGRYPVLTARSVRELPCRPNWVRHLLPRSPVLHFEECGWLNLQSEAGCETDLLSKSRKRRARACAPRPHALALDAAAARRGAARGTSTCGEPRQLSPHDERQSVPSDGERTIRDSPHG